MVFSIFSTGALLEDLSMVCLEYLAPHFFPRKNQALVPEFCSLLSVRKKEVWEQRLWFVRLILLWSRPRVPVFFLWVKMFCSRGLGSATWTVGVIRQFDRPMHSSRQPHNSSNDFSLPTVQRRGNWLVINSNSFSWQVISFSEFPGTSWLLAIPGFASLEPSSRKKLFRNEAAWTYSFLRG